ncbi:phospholipid methyltransferase [Agrobacterium tumefaciens]|uniref:class I SAM-dependent methyltransferase n=1 Tax=Agrobacterium tumefaciens TaxID=358 RepID=UPI001573E17E|nr:rRNA adenine N-6-methyltransferase family protein [Agrobacterium tumefaciens]NTE56442.1 phospholipid methyltransferase [Agrobacterium tumefaciens]NTE74410.1 phospholipid methyltransferase [Agrobacterium tumefaciens]
MIKPFAVRQLGAERSQTRCHWYHQLRFFRAWLAHPLRVASIVPSSRQLAQAITREISARTGPVLELGPGTGVFTRALLARGVAEKDIVLIESGKEFAAMLGHQFPTAKLLLMDAASLIKSDLLDSLKAGAVVSGLPLLSMPMRKIAAILRGSFRHMRHDGVFYQFTYGPRCPVPRRLLDRLGLEAVRISTTFVNLPPASVYRISRRSPGEAICQPFRSIRR